MAEKGESMTTKNERRRRLTVAAARMSGHLPTLERVTVREILDAEARRPMRGGQADLQHGGLFGDAMKQQELGL